MKLTILASAALACAVVGASLAAQAQTIQIPAATELPAALPPAQQARDSAALNLAQAYVPSEVTIRRAQEAFAEQFSRSFDANSTNTALEKQFPGLKEATLAAGRREVGAGYARELPAVHAHLAAFLRQYLNTADCTDIATFLRSALGQKVQGLINGEVDPTALTAAREKGATPALTRDDVKLDVSGLAQLTPSERQQLTAIAATPSYARFQRLAPTLLNKVLEETNGLVARELPTVRAAISAAVQARIKSLPSASGQ